MRKVRLMSFTACVLLVGVAGAQTSPSGPPPSAAPPPGNPMPHQGPCREIVAACENAGFVKGDAKAGNGLWRDCIDPIMRGSSPPARDKLALPPVSPDLVAACRAKDPRFGAPKSAAPGAPPPAQ